MALRFKSPDPGGNCCGCRADPCDDCPETECGATLECERSSASGSKEPPPACAFYEAEEDKWWLKRTLVTDYDRTLHEELEATDGSWHTTIDQTSAGTTTRIEVCDEETEELTVTCSQSRSASGTATTTYPEEPEYNCANGYELSCTTNPADNCDWNEFDCDIDYTSDPEGCSATEFNPAVFLAGSAVPRPPLYEDEWVMETTDQLIERVLGDLPAWAPGGCGASRNLSEDESSFSAAKTRWRIIHPRPSSGAIEVILQEVFTPEDGGTPTISFPSYTWTGDPEGGPIVGSWTTINPPSSDGSTSISIVSINCEFEG